MIRERKSAAADQNCISSHTRYAFLTRGVMRIHVHKIINWSLKTNSNIKLPNAGNHSCIWKTAMRIRILTLGQTFALKTRQQERYLYHYARHPDVSHWSSHPVKWICHKFAGAVQNIVFVLHNTQLLYIFLRTRYSLLLQQSFNICTAIDTVSAVKILGPKGPLRGWRKAPIVKVHRDRGGGTRRTTELLIRATRW